MLPLFGRAGSVLPLGPRQQYTGEQEDAPLEIRVYPGADGSFTRCEDENDNYEKGAYATTELRWNDKARPLTLGERRGPGLGDEAEPAKDVQYTGKKLTVKL